MASNSSHSSHAHPTGYGPNMQENMDDTQAPDTEPEPHDAGTTGIDKLDVTVAFRAGEGTTASALSFKTCSFGGDVRGQRDVSIGTGSTATADASAWYRVFLLNSILSIVRDYDGSNFLDILDGLRAGLTDPCTGTTQSTRCSVDGCLDPVFKDVPAGNKAPLLDAIRSRIHANVGQAGFVPAHDVLLAPDGVCALMRMYLEERGLRFAAATSTQEPHAFNADFRPKAVSTRPHGRRAVLIKREAASEDELSGYDTNVVVSLGASSDTEWEATFTLRRVDDIAAVCQKLFPPSTHRHIHPQPVHNDGHLQTVSPLLAVDGAARHQLEVRTDAASRKHDVSPLFAAQQCSAAHTFLDDSVGADGHRLRVSAFAGGGDGNDADNAGATTSQGMHCVGPDEAASYVQSLSQSQSQSQRCQRRQTTVGIVCDESVLEDNEDGNTLRRGIATLLDNKHIKTLALVAPAGPGLCALFTTMYLLGLEKGMDLRTSSMLPHTIYHDKHIDTAQDTQDTQNADSDDGDNEYEGGLQGQHSLVVKRMPIKLASAQRTTVVYGTIDLADGPNTLTRDKLRTLNWHKGGVEHTEDSDVTTNFSNKEAKCIARVHLDVTGAFLDVTDQKEVRYSKYCVEVGGKTVKMGTRTKLSHGDVITLHGIVPQSQGLEIMYVARTEVLQFSSHDIVGFVLERPEDTTTAKKRKNSTGTAIDGPAPNRPRLQSAGSHASPSSCSPPTTPRRTPSPTHSHAAQAASRMRMAASARPLHTQDTAIVTYSSFQTERAMLVIDLCAKLHQEHEGSKLAIYTSKACKVLEQLKIKFPNLCDSISPAEKNIFMNLALLYNRGIKKLHLVHMDDRAPVFEQMYKYNGKDAAHGVYHFDEITLHSVASPTNHSPPAVLLD